MVDGAGGTRRFGSITLPMLGPTLLFVTIVLTTRAFQAYGEIDLLTQGGPRPYQSTTTLTYLTYGSTSMIRQRRGPAGGDRRAAVRRAAGALAGCSSRGSGGGSTMAELTATMAFDSPRGWRFGRYVLLAVVTFVVLFPCTRRSSPRSSRPTTCSLHPLVPDPFTLDVLPRGLDRGPPRALPVQLARGGDHRHHRSGGHARSWRGTRSRCSTSRARTWSSSSFSPRCWCRSRRRSSPTA